MGSRRRSVALPRSSNAKATPSGSMRRREGGQNGAGNVDLAGNIWPQLHTSYHDDEDTYDINIMLSDPVWQCVSPTSNFQQQAADRQACVW